MGNVIDRILELCDSMGMNISSFASSIGVNQVTLNNYKLGKRKPSLELVEKVANKYPQVSTDWLIRGVGSMCCAPSTPIEEMYNAQGDNSCNTQIIGNPDSVTVALKDQEIKLLQQQVEFLKEQVEFYKNKS